VDKKEISKTVVLLCEETNMKCINCGEEAEYILIFSKMVPLGISVSTFAYGGSYCTKCFTEFCQKREKRGVRTHANILCKSI